MITKQEKIIKKFKLLSDKYHKLSLLFYELSQSLKQEARKKGTLKEFKIYLKTLNLDVEEIKNLSITLPNISLNNIQKEVK